MLSRRYLVATLGLALGTLAAACASSPTACPSDLVVELTPKDTAIVVGRSFQPAVQLWGCAHTQRLTDQITFRAADASVVRVDSATALLVGLRVGSTTVDVFGAKYGKVGAISVSVISSP